MSEDDLRRWLPKPLENVHAVVCCSRDLDVGRLCSSIPCSRRGTVDYNSFAPVDSSAHIDPCANRSSVRDIAGRTNRSRLA
jgi:hypothetical protein